MANDVSSAASPGRAGRTLHMLGQYPTPAPCTTPRLVVVAKDLDGELLQFVQYARPSPLALRLGSIRDDVRK